MFFPVVTHNREKYNDGQDVWDEYNRRIGSIRGLFVNG